MIANWFKGPNEAINIVPMSSGLNRNKFDPTLPNTQPPGAWLAMERDWAAAIKSNQKVSVEINVIYGSNRRPLGFTINYSFDGVAQIPKRFTN